jgi:hypothetical protein
MDRVIGMRRRGAERLLPLSQRKISRVDLPDGKHQFLGLRNLKVYSRSHQTLD